MVRTACVPRSANFARISAQVLDVVARIPRGSVTTFAAIGDELEVPARHVAYVLATLDDDVREAVPWHRVVAEDGGLGSRAALAEARAARLEAEGVPVTGGKVEDLTARFVHVLLDEEHRADRATPLARRPA